MIRVWMLVGVGLVSFSAWGGGSGEDEWSPAISRCTGANGPRAPVSIFADGAEIYFHKDKKKPLDKVGCHKDDYGRYHCH